MAAVARCSGGMFAREGVRGVRERMAVGVPAIVAIEAGRAVGVRVSGHLGTVELLVAADAGRAREVPLRRRRVALAAADATREGGWAVGGQGEACLVVREDPDVDPGRGCCGPVVICVAAAARCGC